VINKYFKTDLLLQAAQKTTIFIFSQYDAFAHFRAPVSAGLALLCWIQKS